MLGRCTPLPQRQNVKTLAHAFPNRLLKTITSVHIPLPQPIIQSTHPRPSPPRHHLLHINPILPPHAHPTNSLPPLLPRNPHPLPKHLNALLRTPPLLLLLPINTRPRSSEADRNSEDGVDSPIIIKQQINICST